MSMAALRRRRFVQAAVVIESGGGGPDLTRLPTLTSINRAPPDMALNAAIRALPAGGTFTDDLSSLLQLKLTDATSPVANSIGGHPYSEGGPYLSRFWGTDQFTIITFLNRTSGSVVYCLHDVTVTYDGTGWPIDAVKSNTRYRTWGNDETCCAFSMHPSTPKRAYVLSGTRLYAFDADDPDTNLDLPHIPSSGKDFASVIDGGTVLNWLTVTADDEWLTLQCEATSTAIAFSPSTGTIRTIQVESPYTLNQLHPEKLAGSTRVFLLLSEYAKTAIWDHEAGTLSINTSLYGGHPAPLFDGFAEGDPYDGPIRAFVYTASDDTDTTKAVATAINNWGGLHKSFHWINGTNNDTAYFVDTFELPCYLVPGSSGVGYGAWSLHSGAIYKSTVTTVGTSGAFTDAVGLKHVYQGTAGATKPSVLDYTLVEKLSVGALVEGSYYYDAGTKTLYVWCFGGGDPTTRLLICSASGNSVGMALHRADAGDARLICAHRSYVNQVDTFGYYQNAFGSMSPSGLACGFSSNMGDSNGRVDHYIAILPKEI